MADALPYKDDDGNAVSTRSKRYAGLLMGDFGGRAGRWAKPGWVFFKTF
jgi:hypothetical protein